MSQEKDVSFNWQNVIFEYCTDAEDVLSHMTDLIKNYGRASITDLYDLAGIHRPTMTVSVAGIISRALIFSL